LSRKSLTLHPTPDHGMVSSFGNLEAKEIRESKITQGRTEDVRCLRNEIRTAMVGVQGRRASLASLPEALLTSPIL